MTDSNAVKVFDAVREGKGKASKKEIALATGLSWGTMYKTVEELLSRGFFEILPPLSGQQGRPSVPFRIRPDRTFLCGMDLGAETTRIIFCDLDFRILFQKKIPTETFTTQKRFFDFLTVFFETALAESGLLRERLSGIGIAVSGVVDPEKIRIVSGGNFGLRRGSGFDLAPFSEKTFLPACWITTQTAAVCAEYHFGTRAHCENLVTVGLGVGIGSGVISDGHLLMSRPDRPVGYIGHILIPGNPEWCSCGFRGCLEARSGSHYLEKIAKREFPRKKYLHSAPGLDRAAAAGDPDAERILDCAAEYNAAGIAAMIQLYSPQSMIFSGGQCKKDSYLFRRTLEHLHSILPPERNNCTLEITSLGEYVSSLGAARLAFEKFTF